MGRRTSTTLSRLTPNAIEVKQGEETIIVATTQDENKILNYFLAAKIRALIEANLQRYKDGETTLTPRELKDVADAGRSLAEFSATLYKESDPLITAEKVVETDDAPNFDKLKPIEVTQDDKLRPEDNPQPVGS